MRELTAEYKKSITCLTRRINELIKTKDKLVLLSDNPEKDPEIIDLNERLKPLRCMLNDLREVAKEAEHYYDRGWWRSEKYTLNQRKSRKFIYCEPIYDDSIE